MSKVKQQHYVPRFYLQNFTHNGDDLYAFDKKDMRSFKTNITRVAQERYFYNTNSEDAAFLENEIRQGPEQFLEKLKAVILENKDEWYIKQFLKEIEQPDIHEQLLDMATNPQYLETKVLGDHERRTNHLFKEVFREIQVRKRIKQGHKKDLALAIAIQALRTPKFRYETIDLQEKVMNQAVQDVVFRGEENDVRLTYNRDFEDRITALALTDPDFVFTLGEIFYSHIWRIGVNITSQPFYTSDAPVVKYGHLNKFIQGVGFGSLGVEVAYPLSPQYILILHEREYFKDKITQENRCITLNEEQVEDYNLMQVTQSRRQLYCPVNEFALAVKLCNKFPEIRDPNRSNIETG